MNSSTVNVGFTKWNIRNRRLIPAGIRKEAVPARDGGLEVIWEIPNEEEQHDTLVSFIWAADGTPVRGSFMIIDWVTDETLNRGGIWDEDALTRIFILAANAA